MPRFQNYRLDLVIESTHDRRTGEVRHRIFPNPERYSLTTHEGDRCLWDKFDHMALPEQMVRDGIDGLSHLPSFYHPPLITNAQRYAEERRAAFGEALDDPQTPQPFADASEDFLRSVPEGELSFAIMSVDIVGSTQLAASSEISTYARVMTAIATELSRVIPLFHGFVLKYTGDGLIAYFPAPNFNGKNDLTIDCALALLRVVRSAINPVLGERALSPVELRIGLDSGAASIVTLGDATAKRQKDILGLTVSLACKIQAQARVGAVALGDETVRALHTTWRQRCRPLMPTDNWNYRRDGELYPLHEIALAT